MKIIGLEEGIKEIIKLKKGLFLKIEKELTKKDNRIAQLDATLKDSAQIFAKQNGIIAALRAQLVKEQAATGISVEYSRHLTKDISRLDEQKKELEQRIAELKAEESKNKILRNKKLVYSKTEWIKK